MVQDKTAPWTPPSACTLKCERLRPAHSINRESAQTLHQKFLEDHDPAHNSILSHLWSVSLYIIRPASSCNTNRPDLQLLNSWLVGAHAQSAVGGYAVQNTAVRIYSIDLGAGPRQTT
jgi:hypothetical protein